MPETAAGLTEPTNDDLWTAVSVSLTAAEAHKMAIYRGEGVQPAEALDGIAKHIAAGLAARVLYDRLGQARALGRAEALAPIREMLRVMDAEIAAGGMYGPGEMGMAYQLRAAIDNLKTP